MAIKIQGDIVIDDDKVIYVGSGTTAERPEDPVLGMFRFNTEEGVFEGYNGVEWGPIGGGAANISFDNTASDLTATDVQDAIDELAAEKADTASLGTAAAANLTTSATDTTAGRVLKVGDFGVGGASPFFEGNVDDFSIAAGLYYVRSIATGTKPNANGHLYVSREGNGLTARQTWFNNTSGHVYVRYGGTYNNQWSSWAEVITDANIKTVNGQSLLGAGDIPIVVGNNFQLFTSNGTFTVPAGVTRIKVTVCGGGGGGGACTTNDRIGLGGGAGAVGIKWITVTPGQQFSVTRGAGGGSGAAGGTSSFGSQVSATGGAAGEGNVGRPGSGGGGVGGTATGGNINIPGARAWNTDTVVESYSVTSGDSTTTSWRTARKPGRGADSLFGVGGDGAASANQNGGAASGFGAGGGGAWKISGGNRTGGAGSNGFVLVEWNG